METAQSASRRGRLAVPLIMGAVLACAGGAYLWRENRANAAQPAAAAAPRSQTVRVNVAPVERRDVPVVLNGLGTVQASQTVNIHARVDGTLQSVNFTEGQNVKAGDVLATLDPRLARASLDQARAAKAKDEAQLHGAEADLSRYTQLVQKDYASRQSVDQQQATVDQLKASIAADDAAIETAQANLDYTSVTAPVDGRMGLRQIDPGNLVHTSDTTPIAVLTALRPVSVIFSLPEKDLDAVKNAQARGAVTVTAARDDGGVLGTGKLTVIDNLVDAGTATLRLKAVFPNDDERLWPGGFVHVLLAVDTVRDALTVPVAAVQRGPDGLFAWVVGESGTAGVKPIETGQVADGVAVVTKGLDAGDRVVTEGQYRLRPNVKVAISGDSQKEAGREHLAEDGTVKTSP
ncbi:efflux RND transporter periplasmic adaptor subunit [Ancylobacter amanitiformis]|uniref:Multidrug efflux system membrane fusion protein n=1 Tax=Ancylobacter amanitiformis TaxID=217069 RepID=A0ABU0LMD7_9HYPH|nr:efflux RND transporter periplasmic adaptor subunit [Ancylobacter amanitiformis]MDQ0509869.1 multidrug efflux system membrane fusion protein [Ancylobacter amanitiformis]